MCKDCGCEEGNTRAYFGEHGHHHHHHHHGDEGAHAHPHEHPHAHDHADEHPHDHAHAHEPHIHLPPGGAAGEIHIHIHHHYHGAEAPPRAEEAAGAEAEAGETPRTLELESRVLAKNDEAAARNRAWLAEREIVAVNLISSPGTGKTTLLTETLRALEGRARCAVIVGDQQTDNDARRLATAGAPVRQIETGASCHLNAEQVGRVLPEVAEGAELLFIENVGNLVCPAAFDLGEQHKIALLSVTEGEDKPLKYPVLFHDSPAVVITKTDLIEHTGWDRKACHDAIHAVRPGAGIYELSAATGEGLEAFTEYLLSLL